MNKDIFDFSIVKEKLSDKKSRNKLYIFLICLAISFFIWFLIKMQKEYKTEIEYPLFYQNLTQNQMITSLSDSLILIEIKSDGFSLIGTKYFKRRKAIRINLSENLIHKNRYSIGDFVLSNELLPQILSQVEDDESIINISPDTLYFRVETLSSKILGIESMVKINLKKQFQQYDEIQIEPKEVLLTGPLSVIDTLLSIRTEEINLDEVQNDIQIKVKLHNPFKNGHVSLSNDSVTIYIPIEKFTEGVLDVSINMEDDALKNIKLFPESVKVVYTVALKDFQKVSADLFKIVLNPNKNRRKNVNVLEYPSFVNIIRVEPEHIEYIILQ